MIHLPWPADLPALHLHLFNTALTATAVAALGLVAGLLCRGASPTLRSGLHKATLVALLATPLLPLLTGVTGPLLFTLEGNLATGPEGPEMAATSAGTTLPDRAPAKTPGRWSGDPAGPATDPSSAATVSEGAGQPQRAAAMSLPIKTPLLWIWAGGVVMGLVNLARSMARLRHLLRTSRPPTQTVLAATADIHLPQGQGPAPEIRTSGAITSPFSCGIARPVIMLPQDLVDRNLIRATVLHELGHLMLGHHLQSLLSALVGILFWWNPLVRIEARRARFNQEECSDACVPALGMDNRNYARALADLALLAQNPRLPAPSLGIGSARGELESRIRKVIDMAQTRCSPRQGTWKLTTAAALGLCLLGLTANLARPQSPATPRGGKKDPAAATTAPKRTPPPAGERQLRTYDFSGWIKGLASPTSSGHLPTCALPGGWSLFLDTIPLRALEPTGPERLPKTAVDHQAACGELLRRLLQLDGRTEIKAAEPGRLAVLATDHTHARIESFRRENTLGGRTGNPLIKYTLWTYMLDRKSAEPDILDLLREFKVSPGSKGQSASLSAAALSGLNRRLATDRRIRRLAWSSITVPPLQTGDGNVVTRSVDYTKDYQVEVKSSDFTAKPIKGRAQEGCFICLMPAFTGSGPGGSGIITLLRMGSQKLELPIPSHTVNLGGTRKVTIQLPSAQRQKSGFRFTFAASGGAGLAMTPWFDDRVALVLFSVARETPGDGRKESF